MKNELLRRLYFGEIHPWERTATPDTDEQELNQRIDKNIQMLRSFMRTEEVATLEQLLGDIDSFIVSYAAKMKIDSFLCSNLDRKIRFFVGKAIRPMTSNKNL